MLDREQIENWDKPDRPPHTAKPAERSLERRADLDMAVSRSSCGGHLSGLYWRVDFASS